MRSRRAYDERWVKLLERPALGDDMNEELLGFNDIPWPIYGVSKKSVSVSEDDFTKDAVQEFLMSIPSDGGIAFKDIIRSSLLRFHPDKFESRILKRVRSEDRDRTKETASIIVRILNDLVKDHR
jgi:hypothetical protein